MAALAPSPGFPLSSGATVERHQFTTEIHADSGAVEALWRELETSGASSPYQRFEWQRAYAEAMSAKGRFETRAVVLRDGAGHVSLLLPLAIERRHGLRIAVPVGGKQANYHLPLFARGAVLPSGAELRALLRETGRALRLDTYIFGNLPLSWDGFANPLAEGGRPSPSNGYRLALSGDAEATLSRALSKDGRKKLRQKDKKLRELGPVAHRARARPRRQRRSSPRSSIRSARDFASSVCRTLSTTKRRKPSCGEPPVPGSPKDARRSSCMR